MTARASRDHVSPPRGRGPWVARFEKDHLGPEALSLEADIILDIALTFPQFRAPGKHDLYELQKERARQTSNRRGFGINRVQSALLELQDRGLYGWRRVTTGRLPGGKADWAFARSFSNQPWDHLKALEALTPDEIRAHYRAAKLSWAARNVVDLDEHRRSRAG